MPRPVDDAMAEGRPEKTYVRSLWVERVAQVDERPPSGRPLYLTLCGAGCHDIQALVDHGIVRTTETGAIHADDLNKVVGVESNAAAVVEARRRFPGLRVLEINTTALVSGIGPFAWPVGEHRVHCQAHVINLDFDSELKAAIDGGHLRFPALTEVAKLAQLHAGTTDDWTLCMTVRGDFTWDDKVLEAIQRLLADNFDRVEQFREDAQGHLGDDLYALIDEGRLPMQELSVVEQQRLLMALVPKRIVQDCQGQGWSIITSKNISYGGESGHAPMVSWIIEFHWDGTTSIEPEASYRASLGTTFEGVVRIAPDGSLS